MEPILKRCALYIPTKDRPQQLDRLLTAYKTAGFRSSMYIGDASTNEASALLSENIAKQHAEGLMVHYRRLASRGIHEGLLDLLENGQEDFAAFVEDDNFVSPEGLAECAKFLSDHPDYRTACGTGETFHENNPQRTSAYPMGSNERERPMDRLSSYFNGGLFLPYLSVHRRSEFIEDLAPVRRCRDVNFIEILVNGLSILRGKAKCIDTFYIRRQVPRPGEYGIPPAVEWITSEGWRDAALIFLSEIAKALVDAGEEAATAHAAAETALYDYLTVRFKACTPPQPLLKKIFKMIKSPA